MGFIHWEIKEANWKGTVLPFVSPLVHHEFLFWGGVRVANLHSFLHCAVFFFFFVFVLCLLCPCC